MSTSYKDMRETIRDYQDELRQLTKKCDSRVLSILEEEAIEMKDEIMQRVPIGPTGRLLAGCYVHIGRQPGKYTILAGAKAIDPQSGHNYAPEQHEDEDYSHENDDGNDRGPHFIAEPFEFTIEVIAERIKKELRI